jgi:CheY-like chemotaxis protein
MRTETRPFEILLAEDNSTDLALVRQALTCHHVDGVLYVMRDGAEAIEWIDRLDTDPEARPLDLVMLDMHLPKCDGEDILRRLHSTEHYAATPVIVMTSIDSSVVEEKAPSGAVLAYFRKPSTLGEFMRLGLIVRRVLALDEPTDDPKTALNQKEVGGAA